MTGLDRRLGKHTIFFLQLLRCFDRVRIRDDAVDRTDFDALRPVEMAYALGAAGGIDDVVLLTRSDGGVRTFRFADIAVDALISNQ